MAQEDTKQEQVNPADELKKAAEAAEQALNEFDADLQSLKDRMIIAQLNGDTELITELQAEYKALMEAE